MKEEGVDGNGRRFEKNDGEQFEFKRTLVCERSGVTVHHPVAKTNITIPISAE